MDGLNKKFNIELEVLSPLHVGVGQEKDWMKGADYVKDSGKVYILNQRKIAEKLSVDELTSFLMNKDDRGLKQKIAGALDEVSDQVFKAPVDSDNDIKVFVKNGLTNKPLVPGSSVKGAIRSVLLEYFINNNRVDKNNRRFEETFFGSANTGDEFMRFIKISDAGFEKTELTNSKIFNLYQDGNELKGGWKHLFRARDGQKGTTGNFKATGFNTIYETLPVHTKSELTISLADKAFRNLIQSNVKTSYNDIDKKREIVEDDITKLFGIINDHTKRYISKEIDFFNKYPNDKTAHITETLKNILSEIPDDNSSCILKMSAGSGFHSITGDWQFDDFSIDRIDGNARNRGKLNNQESAKSRKIAIDGDSFYLMGFVKLSVLSDEEIAKREKERLAKLEEERKKEAERIAKEKAEQERIEAEKRAKEEAARKAEEERIAKEKAERERRETLLKKREKEEKQRQVANKQKKEKLATEGLSILNDIEDFNKGKKIIRDYKKIKGNIDQAQFEFIRMFVERCIHKGKPADWKNIKRGNWKDIKGWVGQEIAKEWFENIMK